MPSTIRPTKKRISNAEANSQIKFGAGAGT